MAANEPLPTPTSLFISLFGLPGRPRPLPTPTPAKTKPKPATKSHFSLANYGQRPIIVKLQWLFVAGFGLVLAGVGLGRGRGLAGEAEKGGK